jgi:phosphatidylinositol alpha-1,6-mannosyltransferase
MLTANSDGDVVHVADTVAALLADSDRRRRYGDAGRTWVEQRWTWDEAARRLQGLLAGSADSPGA